MTNRYRHRIRNISTTLALAALIGCSATTNPTPGAAPTEPQRSMPLVDLDDWGGFTTGGASVKSLVLEGHDLWLGTTNGIVRYDTRTPFEHDLYTPASTGGRLMAKGVYVIDVDSSGAKWIGTYGGGLTRFDGKNWKTYTVTDGLADQWVYDIVFDPQDRMWVATWKGVNVFETDGTIRTYTQEDGLADKWVYSIALDHDGIFWFGTEAGISRFDGKTWKTYTHADGLGADPKDSDAPTSAAVASLPSSGSLDADSGYSEEVIQHHMKAGKTNIGPNPNFVVSSAVDRDNNKWFGTWGAGVSRFDGSTWTNFTTADGLGNNYIQTVVLDPEGRVWVGTNGGVSWFEGGKWHTITTASSGLLDDNVFSIAFDAEGRRWFGTWKGLSMYKGPLPS